MFNVKVFATQDYRPTRLLLLRSPTISLGFTIFGDIFGYVTVF